MKLTYFLQTAAVLHLVLVAAGARMPKAVNLRTHLTVLPPFIQNLFWVYYTFIALCLFSFGVLTFFFADSMAAGEPVAAGLCTFFALFWIIRLIVATFVFDVRPYLTTTFYRLGYHATNLVFIYLIVVYTLTAWKGGRS